MKTGSPTAGRLRMSALDTAIGCLRNDVQKRGPHLQLHEDGVSERGAAADERDAGAGQLEHHRPLAQGVALCNGHGAPRQALACRRYALEYVFGTPLYGQLNTTGPSPGALPSAMDMAHPARISPEVGFRV